MKKYIEQEAVINKLSDMEKLVKKENTIDAIICAGIVHCCIDAVKEAAAADVVEVRHAHWSMLSYDEAVCTRCGYNRNTPFDSTREARERWGELPPYCEMCGAKIDGGVNRVDFDTVKDGDVNDGKADK